MAAGRIFDFLITPSQKLLVLPSIDIEIIHEARVATSAVRNSILFDYSKCRHYNRTGIYKYSGAYTFASYCYSTNYFHINNTIF